MTSGRPTSAIFANPRILIDGVWIAKGDHGRRDHIEPGTGDVRGSFPCGGTAQADAAVTAAGAAVPAWIFADADLDKATTMAIDHALTFGRRGYRDGER